ncbi:MAG TPA: cysteine hydrolase family protein [Candidatus Limnocylindria bacterium]|nr:cysteine hydrolase family protein [Candidatus Limnocylindria bacterium]
MATVLLVIDVQRALVDYLPAERRAAFLATLGPLIDRARAAAIPVVYVRHADEELIPGTLGWDVASEIAPRADEPIVEKRFRDAFRETTLADVLAGLGADHVVVCGMQTEFCVDATLREAERRGYGVTLVADGHATYDVEDAREEQIRAQVNRVAAGLVRIVPAAELFATAELRA